MLFEMLHLWLLLSIQLFIVNYHTTRVTLFYTMEQEIKTGGPLYVCTTRMQLKNLPLPFRYLNEPQCRVETVAVIPN